MDPDYITLRKGPERDREIARIVGNIEKASRIGVSVITYHWTVIPIRRNRQTPGRGKVTYAGFKLEENWKDLPVGKSGRVSAEDYWERIAYFLEKVIPVAKQFDVKMACHPIRSAGTAVRLPGRGQLGLALGVRRHQTLRGAGRQPVQRISIVPGNHRRRIEESEGRRSCRSCSTWASAERSTRCTCGTSGAAWDEFEEVYPDEGACLSRLLRSPARQSECAPRSPPSGCCPSGPALEGA